jgi:hypothetical protein
MTRPDTLNGVCARMDHREKSQSSLRKKFREPGVHGAVLTEALASRFAAQIQYFYNMRNLATTITYPGSLNITRGYDIAGRWTAVQDWRSRLVSERVL